jgi:hypothetical protein
MADGWAIAVRDRETKKIWLLSEDDDSLPADPSRIETHVVPVREEGDLLVFGEHIFSMTCICHPKFSDMGYYPSIIHNEIAVN